VEELPELEYTEQTLTFKMLSPEQVAK